MVSPLNSPPPAGGAAVNPATEAGAAAQVEMKTTPIKLVGVRKVTDTPVTNRGDIKGKVSDALGLLSSEVCSSMASMGTKTPREEVESRLEQGAREKATGFDAHVLMVIDTLLEAVDLDVAASVTAEEPQGKPYAPDGRDNETPVSDTARAFWLSKIPAMRLYVTDKPALNDAVQLAMRFTAQPDSEPSKGNSFTQEILTKLANELNLPESDFFVQSVYTTFKNELIAGDFEGLNILERIFLKCVINNRLDFNAERLELARDFADAYKNSPISSLLVQGEVSVRTMHDEQMLGEDIETEEAAEEASTLRF